jgi:ESCRT-II complex subunit VPS22
MRKRGVGVGSIKQNESIKSALRERGVELQEDRLKHATEVIETFRTQLEEFARAYKTQIKSDPFFRAQFQVMCEKIGVDPLASSKGIWGELLGLGDFYYELGGFKIRLDSCFFAPSNNLNSKKQRCASLRSAY